MGGVVGEREKKAGVVTAYGKKEIQETSEVQMKALKLNTKDIQNKSFH